LIVSAEAKAKPEALLLTREQMAALLGVSPSTFDRHLRQHFTEIPVGPRGVRWSREQGERFVAQAAAPAPVQAPAPMPDDAIDAELRARFERRGEAKPAPPAKPAAAPKRRRLFPSTF
jgi:predicted DNA-binding transcriptional regulator AlpA